MSIDLPLEKMTVDEKLDAMEAIWADLSRTPEQVPMPDWHKEELDRRRARADAEPGVFQDWEEAKREIRDQVE